jgi:signal transduction histidine kinase
VTAATLVGGNPLSRARDLSDLADAARRALRADAVAIVVRSASGAGAALLGQCNVADERLPDVISAVTSTAATAPTRRVEIAGFEAALVGEADMADSTSVAVCALLRDRDDFEQETLISSFAAHAALAVELPHPKSPTVLHRDESGANVPTLPYVTGLGYEELITAVARDIAHAIGPTKVGIHVWDHDKQVVQMVPGSFGADPELIALGRIAADDWKSSVARVFTTGRPYLTNRVQDDPGVLETLARPLGLSRLLVLPLYAEGGPVGVLQLADKAEDFTTADLRAVEPLTGGIAQLLTFTRVRAQLLRRQRLDALLISVAIDIASGKSLGEFLPAAFGELCSAAYAAVIALVPLNGDPQIWRHGEGRASIEQTFVEQARASVDDTTKVVPPERPGDPGWAAVNIAVHAAGVRVGTLAALRHYGVAFNRDERRTLLQFASLIALAWAAEDYQNQRAGLAREFERERIGDVLHDRIAQLLFAARLHLEAATHTPDVPPSALDNVWQASSLTLSAEQVVRTIIDGLTPSSPEEDAGRLLAGTVAAIEDEFGRSVKLRITPAAAAASHRLGSSATDLLAQVTREALVNAAKHAGPCQLSVRLSLAGGNRILLAVTDDGIGTRPGTAGHGLASLRRAVRRHAGTLRVEGGATGGTTVTVGLPL